MNHLQLQYEQHARHIGLHIQQFREKVLKMDTTECSEQFNNIFPEPITPAVLESIEQGYLDASFQTILSFLTWMQVASQVVDATKIDQLLYLSAIENQSDIEQEMIQELNKKQSSQ